MKNQNENDLERVECLIKQERDIADRIFLEDKLVSRLKARLEVATKKRPPSSFWLKKMVPLIGGALFFICGGIIVLDKIKSHVLPEDKLKVTFDIINLNIKVIWYLDENLNLGEKK